MTELEKIEEPDFKPLNPVDFYDMVCSASNKLFSAMCVPWYIVIGPQAYKKLLRSKTFRKENYIKRKPYHLGKKQKSFK